MELGNNYSRAFILSKIFWNFEKFLDNKNSREISTHPFLRESISRKAPAANYRAEIIPAPLHFFFEHINILASLKIFSSIISNLSILTISFLDKKIINSLQWAGFWCSRKRKARTGLSGRVNRSARVFYACFVHYRTEVRTSQTWLGPKKKRAA